MGESRRKTSGKPEELVAPRWLAHTILFIPVAIGLAIVGFSISLFLRDRGAQSWSLVEAVIEDQGSRSRPPTYVYSIDGKEYRSQRTNFGSTGRLRYEKGARLMVHVNPRDPEDAVIYVGLGWGMPGFGLLVLVVAVTVWRTAMKTS